MKIFTKSKSFFSWLKMDPETILGMFVSSIQMLNGALTTIYTLRSRTCMQIYYKSSIGVMESLVSLILKYSKYYIHLYTIYCLHMYIYIHTYTYAYTYTYTYKYTYTYTCTYTFFCQVICDRRFAPENLVNILLRSQRMIYWRCLYKMKGWWG